MTKEELVIGNRYKIRRPSIADGNVNSYQWSDATLVDISYTYCGIQCGRVLRHLQILPVKR